MARFASAVGGVVIAAGIIGAAQSPAGTDERAVRVAEQQFNDARARADVATLDRLLVDEWTITHGDGTIDTKAKYLADLKSGARKFEYVKEDDLAVRLHGDTAVASGTSDSKVQYNGQPSGGALRFTRVFMKQRGTWRMIVSHATRRQPTDAAARTRTPIVATRLFTGPDGQTHAEQVPVTLNPETASGELSDTVPVSGLQFRRTSPTHFNDWHPAPRRQYVITLSGRGEIEIAGGQKIALGPGHILLAEDVTGKGHISRGAGSEDRISLFIPLADRR